MSGQVSRGSAGEYQADERAGVTGLHLRVSGRSAGRCRGAPLASIRQMSGQVEEKGFRRWLSYQEQMSTAAVPNLFGTRDQFRGRVFPQTMGIQAIGSSCK